MDVERELAAGHRRVLAGIERNTRAALARLGVDVDAEERAERERRRNETISSFQQFGAALAEFQLGLESLAKNIRAGFDERMRRG